MIVMIAPLNMANLATFLPTPVEPPVTCVLS